MTSDLKLEKKLLDPTLASVGPSSLLKAGSGILSGGGGGFMNRFFDFIIQPQGETSVNFYTADYETGDAINVQTSLLLTFNRAEEFESLMQTALSIDFFNINLPPPTTNLVRHTAVAHPDHGVHTVVWAMAGDTTPPLALVRFDLDIRRFLGLGFSQEHGP